MKFKFLSDELREHLQSVGKVIGGKNQPAILEYALFEVRGNELYLTTTDAETRITTHFTLMEKEGEDMAFCVRVKQMLEPLREITNQVMEFILSEEQYELEVRYNNGHFSFPVVKGEDFGEVAKLGENQLKIEMPIANLVEGLENTLFAVSPDDVRPIMNGVHFDIRPEHITFVATNGFMLSYYRHSMLDLDVNEPYGVTLHRKPTQLLSQVLDKDDEGKVEMTFYQNYAQFKTDKVELQCRILEGKYPNYETVVPVDNDKLLEADRLQLLAATRRVSIFANKGLDLISCNFTPTQLTLKCTDQDFSTKAEETLPISFSAEEARFSFRSEFLIQALTTLSTEQIEMKMGDATRAAVLTPVGLEAGVEIVVALMPFVYN